MVRAATGWCRFLQERYVLGAIWQPCSRRTLQINEGGVALSLHGADESHHQRLRGSSCPTKKDVAAFRMATSSLSRRFSVFNRLISSLSWQVEKHKRRMLAEVRAYRLRELREEAGLTQVQLAERIGVGQRQVSKIENGDLDSARIGTIRSYLQLVGGGMAIEYVLRDQRIRVA